MRFEYKYMVPMERLEALRHHLLPWMAPDAFAAREENYRYTVRSIYFDTPRFDAYRENLEGLKVRRKLRVRSYNARDDGGAVFLEIKKKFDRRGTKHRAAVRFADLATLLETKAVEKFVLPGKDPAAALDNARRFLFHLIRAAMQPTVLVTYEREAYQGRLDPGLRVTLDTRLRFMPYPALAELFEENRLRHVAPRFFIMEIKFDRGFAPWLQTAVKRHDLWRTSISKYGSCLEACTELHSLLPKKTAAEERRWKEIAAA